LRFCDDELWLRNDSLIDRIFHNLVATKLHQVILAHRLNLLSRCSQSGAFIRACHTMAVSGEGAYAPANILPQHASTKLLDIVKST
jgi:hypothetical protein